MDVLSDLKSLKQLLDFENFGVGSILQKMYEPFLGFYLHTLQYLGANHILSG